MTLKIPVQNPLNSQQATQEVGKLGSIIPAELASAVAKLDFELEEWNHNPRVGSLLSKTVLSGGKRIRPIFSFLMGDFFGLEHKQIAPFARIIELVHAASLAHDDVIDEATHRRGLPSINSVASNKKAVLAGDFLLSYSVDEVASYGDKTLVSCLTRVIRELAEGEWIQIENAQARALRFEDIEKAALHKTGSVMRWCCEIPARLAEIDSELTQKAAEFGETFGLAFQMTDDLLDFKRRDGSEFADLKNKVISFVIFEALKIHSSQKEPDPSQLEKIVWSDALLEASLEKVRAYARGYLGSCQRLLSELYESQTSPSSSQKQAYQAITKLIDYLGERV